MRKNIEREVAAALLAGGSGSVPLEALIRKGLTNYRDVRRSLDSCGLAGAVHDVRTSKSGRDYVRAQLRRGAKLHIHLAPRSAYRDGSLDSKTMPLVTIVPARGVDRRYMDAGPGGEGTGRASGHGHRDRDANCPRHRARAAPPVRA
jgi:hypothetical protein